MLKKSVLRRHRLQKKKGTIGDPKKIRAADWSPRGDQGRLRAAESDLLNLGKKMKIRAASKKDPRKKEKARGGATSRKKVQPWRRSRSLTHDR